MVFAAGEVEGFAVGGEGGGGDSEADVLFVEFGAAFAVEEGGVPFAFEEAVGHEKEVTARMEGEGFHVAFADFSFGGFAFA